MEGYGWAEEADTPVSVVGGGFCYPYSLELIVHKKIKRMSNAQFEVFDENENLLLKVDGSVWNLNMKRILRDPAGYPILTMRGKALSWWHKWKAYEGESNRENNVVFVVEQSHPLQIRKKLNVFVPNHNNMNNDNKKPAFQVRGSYTSLSFDVYEGPKLIAQVKHKFTLESFSKGKETYKVTIYPEVDYAFIVALLVILDENDTP